MKPGAIRRTLVRRIAFLEGAAAHRDAVGKPSTWARTEAEALRHALALAGLVTSDALERETAAVARRLDPAITARAAAGRNDRRVAEEGREHAELVRDLAVAEAAKIVACADDLVIAGHRAARII